MKQELPPGRHGIEGYYSLADLPQSPSIAATAVSTGWKELDDILMIYPNQFSVVSGLPGSGKSTLVMNIMVNLSRKSGIRSFMYAPENERHLKEKFRRIHPGTKEEIDMFLENYCFIQSSAYEYYDQKPRTMQWILDKAQKAIVEDQVGFVMIDPWNELERAKKHEEVTADYIARCIMDLKRFANICDVPVCVIAHPTKAHISENRTPSLSDIEGSMAWYNKCDNGIIVHRDINTGVTRVVSAKVREIGGGRLGECHFTVDRYTERFTPVGQATVL